MAHQCPLIDRHKFDKNANIGEESRFFKSSYFFCGPNYIYFCENNSFIAFLSTLKLKNKNTDVSVNRNVFAHITLMNSW